MEDYKIFISEPAEDDIRDIFRYISLQLSAPITAEKMMESIEKDCRHFQICLKAVPLSGMKGLP